MTHIGRTHRISTAWLYDQLQSNNINMFRADSELMAADIFTKAFPDGKLPVWLANLALINIYPNTSTDNIAYHPELIRSMRGDLDKDRAIHIDQAKLPDDDPALPGCVFVPEDDDSSTACPTEDDRDIAEFGDDDNRWNYDWDPVVESDWTNDIPCHDCLGSKSDLFHDCRMRFEDDTARPLLAAAAAKIDHRPYPLVIPFPRSFKPKPVNDYWEVAEHSLNLIRHHVQPRTKLFSLHHAKYDLDLPSGVLERLYTPYRCTKVNYAGPFGEADIRDDCSNKMCANRSLKAKWTGRTEFPLLKLAPEKKAHVCAPAPPDCDGNPFRRPTSWNGIDRVLIEFCAYEDSELGKPTAQSHGCYTVRCTIS